MQARTDLISREPKDGKKKEEAKQQAQQSAQDKAQDKGASVAKDAAKKGAKKVAEKAGEKAGIKVGVAVATAAVVGVPVVGEIVQAAKALESIVEGIIGAIKKASAEDHAKECKYTYKIVTDAFAQNNKFNYLAINKKLKQSVNMHGVEGKDWHMFERDLKIHFGTMRYHFYSFGDAEVQDKGNGGYENWAFDGKFTRNEQRVVFTKPK